MEISADTELHFHREAWNRDFTRKIHLHCAENTAYMFSYLEGNNFLCRDTHSHTKFILLTVAWYYIGFIWVMCLSWMSICAPHKSSSPPEARRENQMIFSNWSHKLLATRWVLNPEPRSSAGAVSTLHCHSRPREIPDAMLQESILDKSVLYGSHE